MAKVQAVPNIDKIAQDKAMRCYDTHGELLPFEVCVIGMRDGFMKVICVPEHWTTECLKDTAEERRRADPYRYWRDK